MTDIQFAAYEAKREAAAKLANEILPHNKQVLFDALAAAGIVLVTITFDGSGDSGQFEQLAGFDAENHEVPVPTADITVRSVNFDLSTVEERTTAIGEFIETLAYDFLEETHSGWEDGEGAYGEFKFALADRAIVLEYNERYTETHYHEHEF